MARVKTYDTRAEVSLRSALWSRGIRYRLHVQLPGRPDIVFPASRIALFVDGCFWHGCPTHYKAPRNNQEFWRTKLEENRTRDHRVNVQLQELGWTVIRIWEHEIEQNLSELADKLAVSVRGRRGLGAGN